MAEDITRLSGAGDIQSIVHMEQPSGMNNTAHTHLLERCIMLLTLNTPVNRMSLYPSIRTEIKRLIDTDENHINQWSHDAQVYAETYVRCGSSSSLSSSTSCACC